MTELEADSASLVGSFYSEPDYRDRFVIHLDPQKYESVDQVVTDWFTKQPAWIRLLSTNSISKAGITSNVEFGGYTVGHSVGSWTVLDRNDTEILFGDQMGFMEYRFSFRLVPGTPEVLEGSTAVKFLWKRTGRFYFALVKPMHRRFTRLLLARTVA